MADIHDDFQGRMQRGKRKAFNHRRRFPESSKPPTDDEVKAAMPKRAMTFTRKQPKTNDDTKGGSPAC
jgi:hypothetical protein